MRTTTAAKAARKSKTQKQIDDLRQAADELTHGIERDAQTVIHRGKRGDLDRERIRRGLHHAAVQLVLRALADRLAAGTLFPPLNHLASYSLVKSILIDWPEWPALDYQERQQQLLRKRGFTPENYAEQRRALLDLAEIGDPLAARWEEPPAPAAPTGAPVPSPQIRLFEVPVEAAETDFPHVMAVGAKEGVTP